MCVPKVRSKSSKGSARALAAVVTLRPARKRPTDSLRLLCSTRSVVQLSCFQKAKACQLFSLSWVVRARAEGLQQTSSLHPGSASIQFHEASELTSSRVPLRQERCCFGAVQRFHLPGQVPGSEKFPRSSQASSCLSSW